MSERYTRVFTYKKDTYAEGSPVIIVAGALLTDNITGNSIAQLKFECLTDKSIKALTVEIISFDTANRPLGNSVKKQYLDLNVNHGEEFGSKNPILLPDNTTRSFEARVIEVIFTDNTVWNSCDSVWEKLPELEHNIIKENDTELKKQFLLKYGITYNNDFKQYKDLWFCPCGAVNKNASCYICGTDLLMLSSIDYFALKQECDERVAAEKAEAERIAEESRKAIERAAEQRKKREEAERLEHEANIKRYKKFAAIATPIICAVIAFFVILNSIIIPNSKYNDAIALMDAGKYTEAISAFEALDGYKDSATKITECNTAILDGKYNDAITLMNAGNIVEAYEALVVLEGYKDSTDKANAIYDQYKVEKLKVSKAGDYVFFGAYEQDNNTSNGKEDVEWLVLEVKDGKALVISKYALDCKPYNTSYTDVTWETCTLRKWLNNDFINAAFSADEKAMIPTVTVSADKNPEYSTNPGNATQDQVFLLSITEANKYFSSDSARQCEPTDYAVANGAWKSDSGNCWWWLRSPGYFQYFAANVYCDGDALEYGYLVTYDYYAVRPAMWITIK